MSKYHLAGWTVSVGQFWECMLGDAKQHINIYICLYFFYFYKASENEKYYFLLVQKIKSKGVLKLK